MKQCLYPVIWATLLAILAGCDLHVPPPVAPSSMSISTTALPPTATNTPMIAIVSSVTETPAIAPSHTPLPVLSSDERERRILELILNNGNCNLPCWWGIVPGETTFADARNFLRQFNPYPYLKEETPNKQFVNYLIPVPASISSAHGIDVNLDVVDEIVRIVSTEGIESAAFFSIQNMLSAYGEPSEVWIHTYRSYLGGVPPVDVLLFYPDQGILARYSTELSEINKSKDSATICLDRSPTLTLWSPEDRISFEQAQDYARLDYKEYGKPLLHLEEATVLSIEEFYDYRTKERVCIPTKLSLWPEP